MTRIAVCECGFIAEGHSEDELVEAMKRHLEESHPQLAGAPSSEDLRALAEDGSHDRRQGLVKALSTAPPQSRRRLLKED